MTINQLISGALLLGILVSGCNTKKENESAPDGKSNGTVQEIAPSLPYLAAVEVTKLYTIAEGVDILFYKLPISVSQDDAASAKNTAMYISPAAPRITSKCEPIGRISFLSDGKIAREADFYIGEGCNYFAFFENGKAVYNNAMAPEGVQYFQTLMSQTRPPDKK